MKLPHQSMIILWCNASVCVIYMLWMVCDFDARFMLSQLYDAVALCFMSSLKHWFRGVLESVNWYMGVVDPCRSAMFSCLTRDDLAESMYSRSNLIICYNSLLVTLMGLLPGIVDCRWYSMIVTGTRQLTSRQWTEHTGSVRPSRWRFIGSSVKAQLRSALYSGQPRRVRWVGLVFRSRCLQLVLITSECRQTVVIEMCCWCCTGYDC